MEISSIIKRGDSLYRYLPAVLLLCALSVTTTVIATTAGGIDGNDYTISADDNINLKVDFTSPTPDGTGAVLITGSTGASDIILDVDGASNITGDLTVGGSTSLATIGTSGLAILNEATVNTTLGVTGTTNLQGATTVNNTLAVDSNGITTGGNRLDVDGTSTRITSGANILTVNATNGTTVSGNTSLTTAGGNTLEVDDTSTRITSGTNNLTVNATNGTTVSGNTLISTAGGNTLEVDDTSTRITNGTNILTVNATNGTTISGNTLISTAGGNTLEVDDTSTRITSGTNSLTVDATTGTSINGNLTVNGTITTFNPIANSGITNGNNSVLISGANNEISITADDNANTTDGRGNISISNTQATVTVTNSSGNTHGLTVSETETELSGGSNSTTITLDDNGATFSDSVTSGPVKVTGVANGVDHFDAVNRSQLNGVATRAYSGIASVAALAAIPEPIPGKRYSLGVGLGHYAGEEALAIGFKSNIGNSMRFSTAIGRSHGNTTTNAGLGFSW